MFIPKPFRQENFQEQLAFIQDFPLASLVVMTEQGLSAHQIPLLIKLDEKQQLTLQGHIALANPLSKQSFDKNVLAIFNGPNAYISPNWYPSKKQDPRVVPTWNYQALHAHGELSLIDDVDWKRAFLEKLTERHERDQSSPWQLSDAPDNYIHKMLKAIIGVELNINQIECSFKTSQNKPRQIRDAVRKGLELEGNEFAQALSSSSLEK